MSALLGDQIFRVNSPCVVQNRIFHVCIQKPCLNCQLASFGKIKAGKVTYFADLAIADDNALRCISVVIDILDLLCANLKILNTRCDHRNGPCCRILRERADVHVCASGKPAGRSYFNHRHRRGEQHILPNNALQFPRLRLSEIFSSGDSVSCHLPAVS